MPNKFYSWVKKGFVAAAVLLYGGITESNAQVSPCTWSDYSPFAYKIPASTNPCNLPASSSYANGTITSVRTTGGIRNITQTSSCSQDTDSYTFYYGLNDTVEVNADATVNVEVTAAFNRSLDLYKAFIYVDWQHKGWFDPVADKIPMPAGQPNLNLVQGTGCKCVTIPVKIPKSAQNGFTRMRIRLAGTINGSYAGINGACDTVNLGETEDYVMKIRNTCLPPSVISIANVTCSSADIAWSSRENATFYDVWVDSFKAPWSAPDAVECDTSVIISPNGTLDTFTPPCKFWHQIGGTSTQLPGPVNAHLMPNTKYYVCIRSICDTFQKATYEYWDTSAAWIIDSFTTLPCCEAPKNVKITNVQSTTADASWDPVFTANGYEYIVDLKHGLNPAGGTVVYNTHVKLNGLASSTIWYFYVRARCSPTPLSDWTEEYISTANTTNVGDLGTPEDGLYVFPNPVDDQMIMQIAGQYTKGNVIVTDLNGKVVSRFEMDGKTIVNTSSWAPGVYIVKYQDDISSKVIKVNKL